MIKNLMAGLLALASAAPAAEVTGRLRELGGSAPVAGASVSAEGLTRAALSDAQGAWKLELPEGWQLLKVSADDYAPVSFALTVTASPAPVLRYLQRTAFEAEAFTVRGRRETEAPSRTSLERKEIRRIAGIGRDPLRALQTLPGVVTPGDFSGQLAVRGGGPQDNAYLLNNVPWPVPFHYGGALSTVHGDLMETVDFYAAAFPPRWGGVDGAVLDASSRPAKRDQVHGQLDVNMLLGEGLIEGPLGQAGAVSPTTEMALPKGGWLLSGRRSYMDLFLGKLVSGFTALPTFWDLSLVGDYDLGPNDSVNVTALATDDVLALVLDKDDVNSKDFEGEFRFRNAFQSLGASWKHRGDGWRQTLTPYHYRASFDTSIGDRKYFISIQPDITGLRHDLRADKGDHELGLGWGAQHYEHNVFGYIFRRNSGAGSGAGSAYDPAGITVTTQTTDGYAYLQDRVTLAPGLRLLGGLRWQRVDQMGTEAIDPRVNLEWKLRPQTAFTAGWGLYSQFPTPQQLSKEFGNPALDFNRTEHVVAGVEQGLGPATSVKVEAYYKTYRNRVVAVPDSRLYANDGEGSARGAELMIRHAVSRRFFGWLSYSYAKSQRLEGPGQPWRDYQYDQPQTLTLVGSYDLTPKWSAGAKLNYHSGPLITPVVGRYADAGSNSGFSPVYGEPYSERLGDYLRLDLRTDYAFLFHGWKLNLYAEVINALNRPNPAGLTYSKDYSRHENVNNLPLLPYLGLGAEF
jgi:hypothetical protein